MALGSKAHKKLQFDHFHLLGNCLFHKMYKKFIYEFLMFTKKKKKKKKKLAIAILKQKLAYLLVQVKQELILSP